MLRVESVECAKYIIVQVRIHGKSKIQLFPKLAEEANEGTE